MKSADDFVINPVKLTKAIKKAIGDVESAKTLRNGNILIFCKNGKTTESGTGHKISARSIGELHSTK